MYMYTSTSTSTYIHTYMENVDTLSSFDPIRPLDLHCYKNLAPQKACKPAFLHRLWKYSASENHRVLRPDSTSGSNMEFHVQAMKKNLLQICSSFKSDRSMLMLRRCFWLDKSQGNPFQTHWIPSGKYVVRFLFQSPTDSFKSIRLMKTFEDIFGYLIYLSFYGISC